MGTQSIGLAVITVRSSGIGAVYAYRLARRGYDLLSIGRNRECSDDPAKKLAAAMGLKVEILVDNLLDSKELAGLKRIFHNVSTVTQLVNNAWAPRTSIEFGCRRYEPEITERRVRTK